MRLPARTFGKMGHCSRAGRSDVRADSPRWREVTASEFPHEREGLAHLRELLPDRGPFRAWTNFEFRDRDGKWYEIDALVLGERRLHLIELKHYQGTITGNAYRWQRNGRSEDSPLLLARRKAQRLKGVITEAIRQIQPNLDPRHIPFVQHSVFLHAANGRCALPPSDATDLFGLDGSEHRSGLPSIAQRVLEPALSGQRAGLIEHDDLLVQLFERIGFALRREHEVGSWRIVGEPLAEGEGWQDWPAEHRLARRDEARIRFFVSKAGASDEERRNTLRLAEREYALTSRLHHDAILRPRDLVEDELGVGLVYPRDDAFARLDLWLNDHGHRLSLHERVGMIRQLAEALAYAHRHHVVHRGLSPVAVLARWRTTEEIEIRLGDWQVAGADAPGNSTPSPTATRLFAVLEGREAVDSGSQPGRGYLAPEGRWDRTADRIRLDVFALGAMAYHIVAGRPPATDELELRERVARDRGLDLVADVPEVPPRLRDLILRATRPTVSDRLADVQAFLGLLDEVDREVAAGTADLVDDPLDAAPGMMLGQRFELLRRLGSGSTAVGLLVNDRAAGGERRVLKVAVDDAAAARLRGEAEVLASLPQHPRLIRLVEKTPLEVGKRTALLLESAGESTLAEVLRERPRLSIDLLDRFGTDLLQALVALDKAGIDHRDIKPANLGVREQRGDRAKHLVLFDFSLSRAGASAVEAGTPPYLDPFLGSGLRPTWDSAAERYAAAVTLFEMATGQAPRFGDGRTNPAVIPDEATVEPAAFDPSIAGTLADFFRRALRQDARERFHTAAEMLTAWRAIFPDRDTSLPDDADELAAAAQPSTPLAKSGLSARALSALEPLGLETAGDLAAVDPGRLSRLAGVADPTRREVRSRAKQWRTRFGPAVGSGAEPTTAATGLTADVRVAADLLIRVARTPARQRVARRVLGLPGEADIPPDVFAPLAELAAPLGLNGGPQVSLALSAMQEAWAADDEARFRLDAVLGYAHRLLIGLGGVAGVDHVVAAWAAESGAAETSRMVAGLLKLALDRADIVERGGGDRAPIVRRRRRKGRTQLLAITPALLDVADLLGERADELVTAAVTAGEDLIPVSRAAARLRTAWPTDAPPIDDIRLVRLAARLATRAGASWQGELHDRHLDAAVAVRNALGGVAPSQQLTVRDLLDRVRARFPDLPALPGRPHLDGVVTKAGVPLQWNGEAYAVPSRPSDTTLTSRTAVTSVPVSSAAPTGSAEDIRLAESVRGRGFLALGVPPLRLDAAAAMLAARHGAHILDVTAVLLEALRAESARRGVPWDEVRAADAAEPGSRPAQGLSALVRAAMPAVGAAINEASDAAPEGTRPVLLVEAAPLARYEHTEVLARLADLTARRSQTIWLLLPDEGRGALLDGVPLRLGHGGQFLRLNEKWLHTSAAEKESV
ncbi:BREX system serine/threonine kinase PglW [Actinoplanes xinjiangensis]|uniref:BREX system serine/threonine kinase PglW n=1 Tax=Actinoplanes xinjiangensis TaxID=512350 RepID=UPI00130E11F6|nr:BREX system serine/threonine kinase PglW [Actinoplanes xinjiangensis]